MKNLKLFVVIIIGIISITMSSCQKDDELITKPEPIPTIMVGKALDSILFQICQQSALDIFKTDKIDTTWLTMDDGSPLLDGDNNQLFETKVITVTLESERIWIKVKTQTLFNQEKYRIVEYFKTHDANKMIIGYPDSLETRIIYRLDLNNKSFVNVLENGFSSLSQRLFNSAGKPLSQVVSEGVDQALVPTQNAVLATLDDEVKALLP